MESVIYLSSFVWIHFVALLADGTGGHLTFSRAEAAGAGGRTGWGDANQALNGFHKTVPVTLD